MTTRSWYLTKAAGFRVLVVISLAWWTTATVCAVSESQETDRAHDPYSWLVELVLANG